MENDLIIRKEKLEFSGILKESFKIQTKSPKFLLYTSLTLLPLFLSLVLFETVLQETIARAIQLPPFTEPDTSSAGGFRSFYELPIRRPFSLIRTLLSELSPFLISLCSVYCVLVHPLDLLNTIFIVRHSSEIYTDPLHNFNFGDFWSRPIKNNVGFRGPLVTSLYALFLSAIVLVGLLCFSSNYVLYFYSGSGGILEIIMIFTLCGGLPFIALIVKYMEWSAIWNTGIVVSVLEAKHGVVGIGVAAYYSRGRRTRGFLLNVVVFTWRVCLRLVCLYLVVGKGWDWLGPTAAQVFGVCLGNVVKWVVFMVYFCDCKKRFLEKKVDLEDARTVGK